MRARWGWFLVWIGYSLWCLLDGSWYVPAIFLPLQLWEGYELARVTLARRRAPNDFVALLHATLEQRRDRWRRWAFVPLVIASWAVVRTGGEVYARARFGTLERGWRALATAESTRLAELARPPLDGEATEEDAAPLYAAAFAAVGARVDAEPVAKAAKQSFAAPLDPAIAETLARVSGAVASVRRGTGAARCRWPADTEGRPILETPPELAAARLLGAALVLDGHAFARRGVLREAAGCYMAAVRLGGDFALRDMMSYLYGVAIAQQGLDSLGTLIVATPKAKVAELDDVPRVLDALDRALPDAEHMFRAERLTGFSWLREYRLTFFGRETTPHSVFFPERLLFAHSLAARDEALEALAEAAHGRDPRLFAAASRAVDEQRRSWNPVVGTMLEHLAGAGRFEACVRAKLRMVAVALAVEREHARTGSYPLAPELPEDPLGDGARLRFRCDGDRYAVSSAGDGVARPEYWVLERR